MKIGLMGAWNLDSGASIHTELIGRSFIELGHEVVVFSFFKHSFHGTAIVGSDEDYVKRCFTVSSDRNPQLLSTPFLINDYNFFVVEDLGMLPCDHLGKIFNWIKKKAKAVTVIHDGNLKEDPSFYQFDWDAVVCFDERYYNFLKLAYPKDIIHIIPYPCYPWSPGDMEKSRKDLDLPRDKKIILLFGPSSRYGAEKFHVLKQINNDYPILCLIVTKHPESLKKWQELKSKSGDLIEIRQETPKIDRLYEYLYASDLLLYNKPSIPGVVTVSSTAFQCLGSGRPMVALKSSFVETMKEALYCYANDEELRSNIISIFKRDERYKKVLENAREYVNKNSAVNVAKKFIELFEQLGGKK